MTYSIVARDSATGQVGVAIQSHYFCVGDGAPWLRPDVGSICTQAFIQRAYGPQGLLLLERGEDAAAVVERLVADDPNREKRQVGVVDATGRAAAFTGKSCIQHAGHCVREGVAAQANLVSSPGIWGAMVSAFESASGRFADRLLDALFAAEAEGGDHRGRQSAALITAGSGGETVNLRVDDNPEPLLELRRLLAFRRAYDIIEQAHALLASGIDGSLDGFVADLEEAAAVVGDNPEGTFWLAVVLARQGKIDEARQRFSACVASNAGWLNVANTLPNAGLLEAKTVSLLVS